MFLQEVAREDQTCQCCTYAFLQSRKVARSLKAHRCYEGLVMLHLVSDEPSHARTLERIEQLWDAAPGTAEALELDALATLVDAYERKTFPIDPLV